MEATCKDHMRPVLTQVESSAEPLQSIAGAQATSTSRAQPVPGIAPALGGAVSAAALVACGGGASGSAPAPGSLSPPPVSPTAAQAARFLHQAQFSASSAEIAALQSLGHSGWLEQQFNAPASTSGWDWLVSRGYNDASFNNSVAPADYMVWNQLITAPDTLRKRLALAWSEIFVVSGNSMPIAARSFAMAAYWDTLCANAFSTYRQLLEAVTLNPAMGAYLNTRGNQKEDAGTGRQPDENYGREVMQLFSIGLYRLHANGTPSLDGAGQLVETYDQSSVSNIARAFTGWDFDSAGATANNPLQVRNPMRLIASRHSTQAASFLGTSIAAGTDGTTALRLALDTLAGHPNVAPFIGRQLIQRLVTSNPSSAYVGRVAAAFNDNGAGVRGDLKAVLRAVLLDAEALDAGNSNPSAWGKLREPIVRFTQWARTFHAASASGDWKIGDLSSDATRLGQSPLRAPSVFNFFRPGYVPPNTALAGASLVAPEFQITNESTVASYVNFMQSTIQSGFADVQADYASELALAADPQALLDRLNLLLCAGRLGSDVLQTIRNAIGTIAVASSAGQLSRVHASILLVMASPQYIVQR